MRREGLSSLFGYTNKTTCVFFSSKVNNVPTIFQDIFSSFFHEKSCISLDHIKSTAYKNQSINKSKEQQLLQSFLKGALYCQQQEEKIVFLNKNLHMITLYI